MVGIMTLLMLVGSGGLSRKSRILNPPLPIWWKEIASLGKHYSTAEEGIACGPHESDLAVSPRKSSGKPR